MRGPRRFLWSKPSASSFRTSTDTVLFDAPSLAAISDMLRPGSVAISLSILYFNGLLALVFMVLGLCNNLY